MPTKYQCKLSTYRGDFKNLVLLLLFCFQCERWCENKGVKYLGSKFLFKCQLQMISFTVL